MPLETQEFDEQISRIVGRLQGTTDRLTEASQAMREEINRLHEKMAILVAVETELREYRKTMHDRLNRIHVMIAEDSEKLEDYNDRLRKIEDDILANRERIATLWKVGAALGGALLTVTGWFSGVLQSLFRGLTGGQ